MQELKFNNLTSNYYKKIFPIVIFLRIYIFYQSFSFGVLLLNCMEMGLIYLQITMVQKVDFFWNFCYFAIPLHQYLSIPRTPVFLMPTVYIFLESLSRDEFEGSIFGPFIVGIITVSSFFGGFTIYESIGILLSYSLLYSFVAFYETLLSEYFFKKFTKEKEILQQNEKLSVLTIASHELKNPLQALSFLVSFLRSQEKKQNEIIEDIKSTVYILNSIVENVLDFSKISKKKLAINSSKLNILETVERIGTIYFNEVSLRGINLYIDVDPNIPRFLLGDEAKLSQVLSNLLSNASKFTNHGSIMVSVRLLEKKDKKCKIAYACHDSGIGIKKEYIDSIFMPFEQIENKTNLTDKRGWGLGLSIVKELIHIMKGEIRVESEYLKGTKVEFILEHDFLSPDTLKDCLFTLTEKKFIVMHRNQQELEIITKYLNYFGATTIVNGIHTDVANKKEYILIVDKDLVKTVDLKEYKKAIFVGYVEGEDYIQEPICLLKMNKFLSSFKEKSPKLTPKRDLEDLSILLVEDNIMIHKLEKNLLKQNGVINVQSAYNGIEALEIIEKSRPFDLILLDIQMPKLNGIETTKRIRDLDDTKKAKTPIVIITGNNSFDFQTFLTIGANAVISKPVCFEDLFQTIKKLLKIN